MASFDVAIVHHRTPDILADAVVRLKQYAPDARVMVLDTGPDPVRDVLGAEVVPVVNHSYAHVVNVALRRSRGEHVAVMNADVRVEPDTLQALQRAMAAEAVAAAGPLCRTPDGAVQDQGVPYRWFTLRAERAGRGGGVDAPWLSGCLIMLRRAAARALGGFDTRLRFGNEDLEWCLRARRAGWRCRLLGASAIHLGGSATPDDARFLLEGLRGGMSVARRHHRPTRRALQGWAVRWACEVQGRWGAPRRRDAYRAAARMFARGLLEESPFGATLGEANEAFDRALGDAAAALGARERLGPRQRGGEDASS